MPAESAKANPAGPVKSHPRILVVGEYRWPVYERAFCDALRRVGADVVELPTLRFFGPGDLLRRAQTKYCVGPGIAAANAALIATCALQRPDVLLALNSDAFDRWSSLVPPGGLREARDGVERADRAPGVLLHQRRGNLFQPGLQGDEVLA